MLVDVPCSGLGIIRRDPEIRWRRQPEDLAGFATDQRAMLAHAADAVRPGGRLVYATCSSEPEENAEVVAAFLAEHPDFAPTLPEARDASRSPGLHGVINDAGHLSTTPDVHRLEAFFAVALRRRQDGAHRDGPADL